MKLTILGSGTGRMRVDRGAPGYLVEVDKKLIMLDSGDGTPRQIVKAGYDFTKLTQIFYTHTHIDHVSALPAILWGLPWNVGKVLKVYGPPRFEQFYKNIVSTFFPGIEKKIRVEIKEVKNSNFRLGSLNIKTRLMSERVGEPVFSHYEVGYRLTCKGKSLVFCGDNSEESWQDIVTLAKNCDLLILESAWPKPKQDHLTPEIAGQIAQEAGVKKLVLTHFYPEVEKIDIKKKAGKYYEGPIVLARDLMKIKI